MAQLQAAIQKYGKKDPWASKAFYEIAYMQSQMQQPKLALKNLEECLRLPEPHTGLHTVAQNLKLNLLTQTGQTSEAIKAATALGKSGGKSALSQKLATNALMLKAEMQERQARAQGKKSSPEALKTYREFLNLPASQQGEYAPDAIRALAHSLEKSGQKAQTLKMYDEYLRRFSKNKYSAQVALERFTLLRGSLSHVTAADLKEICARYPTDNGPGQGVIYEWGMKLRLEGKAQDAAQKFREVLHNTGTAQDGYSPYVRKTAGEMILQILADLPEDQRASWEQEAKDGIRQVDNDLANMSGVIAAPVPLWKRPPVLLALSVVVLVGIFALTLRQPRQRA